MVRSHSLQYLMAFWHEVNMDFFFIGAQPVEYCVANQCNLPPAKQGSFLQRCQREFRTHRLSLHIKNAVRSVFVWLCKVYWHAPISKKSIDLKSVQFLCLPRIYRRNLLFHLAALANVCCLEKPTRYHINLMSCQKNGLKVYQSLIYGLCVYVYT